MELLQQSRQYNRTTGITGVLLLVEGRIVQVLEGQQEAINSLFGRIQQDRRHRDITCVVNQRIAEPVFPQWSMGYEVLKINQLEEVISVVDLDKGAAPTLSPEQPLVLQMIQAFYEMNRLS